MQSLQFNVNRMKLCSHKGCSRCKIAMPDDAATEKSVLLQALGAEVGTLKWL